MFERPATHFDPDKIGQVTAPLPRGRIALEPKFDAARLAARAASEAR